MPEKQWRSRWLCARACRRQNKRLPDGARIVHVPVMVVSVMAVQGGTPRRSGRRWVVRSRLRMTA